MEIDEQMVTEPEQAGHSLDETDALKTVPPVNVISPLNPCLKLFRTKLLHQMIGGKKTLLLNIRRGLLCRYKTMVSESNEVPMRMDILMYIFMPRKRYSTPEIPQSTVGN